MIFVLVHSTLVGPSTWLPVSRELERRGHQVLVPSLLGVADAPAPQWQYCANTVREQVGNVVHELMPFVILADWFIAPPTSRLAVRKGAVWLAFPLVWIVFTLIRGAATGKYPYPFLNPTNGGYGNVILYCVAILLFMLLACAVIVWLGNLRSPARVVEPAA